MLSRASHVLGPFRARRGLDALARLSALSAVRDSSQIARRAAVGQQTAVAWRAPFIAAVCRGTSTAPDVAHLERDIGEPDVAEKAKHAFDGAWARLESCGVPLVFPREIIWLNGAPGSGKSFNSKFIMKIRGFAHNPLVMSELLQTIHPEEHDIISGGQLVDDEKVVGVLLRELVRPVHRAGALVDGFPRTKEQVAMLPLLCDKMSALRKSGIVDAPKPKFFVCILNVGRAESCHRQQLRGQRSKEHNERVKRSGIGELMEERPTDYDPDLIEQRYEIFKAHRDTIKTLHRMFHFHEIDTEQPVAVVQDAIRHEFAYQSERELDTRTYESLGNIPMADTLQDYARAALVQRLDTGRSQSEEKFDEAVAFVLARVIPACRMAAFSGTAQLRLPPEDPFHGRFGDRNMRQLVVDVLSERGYKVCVFSIERDIPTSVLPDGSVELTRRVTYGLNVRFPPAHLRD